MGANGPGTTDTSQDGGVGASLPAVELQPLFVAPATTKERNLLAGWLIPVACWRVDDIRFEFDSSFVLPDAAGELQLLADLRQTHAEDIPSIGGAAPAALFPVLSLFGHADPTGDDDYNKNLSGRRARCIFALLTRQPSMWEELYAQPFGGDDWKRSAIESVCDALGTPEQARPAHQSAGTRAQLFRAYMDLLCGDLKLDPHEDFLAGTDAGGKGDYQGCSDFNPILLFSKEEEAAFAKASGRDARNIANASNRRVLALLFRPGSKILAAKWPCPRAKEGAAGCRKRFWSDSERRRHTHLSGERREFSKTKDTFACRFYQRLTGPSPCEHLVQIFRVRLFDWKARVIPKALYRVLQEGGDKKIKTADENGDITVRVLQTPGTVSIQWSRPLTDDRLNPEPDDIFGEGSLPGLLPEVVTASPQTPPSEPLFEFHLDVFLDVDGIPQILDSSSAPRGASAGPISLEAAKRRLNNLGYTPDIPFEENVRRFQKDAGLTETGAVAEAASELMRRHDECDPPPKGRA